MNTTTIIRTFFKEVRRKRYFEDEEKTQPADFSFPTIVSELETHDDMVSPCVEAEEVLDQKYKSHQSLYEILKENNIVLAETARKFSKSTLVVENSLSNHLSSYSSSLEEELNSITTQMKENEKRSAQTQEKIYSKQQELNTLKTKKGNLDPVEMRMYDLTKTNIEGKINMLNQEMKDLAKHIDKDSYQIKILNEHISIAKNYLELDLSFLSMTKKQSFPRITSKNDSTLNISNIDLPRFAVFNYNSSQSFELTYELNLEISSKSPGMNYNYNFTGVRHKGEAIAHFQKTFPETIADPLNQNSFHQLSNYTTSTKPTKAKFSCDFQGFIPEETKKKVKVAKKTFGHDIYIITEAKNWNVQIEKLPEPIFIPFDDPLVIGVKYGKAYLIDTFDCTPIEQYVSETYLTVKPKNN